MQNNNNFKFKEVDNTKMNNDLSTAPINNYDAFNNNGNRMNNNNNNSNNEMRFTEPNGKYTLNG